MHPVAPAPPVPTATSAPRAPRPGTRTAGLLALLAVAVATAHAALLMRLDAGLPAGIRAVAPPVQVRLVEPATSARMPAGAPADPTPVPPRRPARRPGSAAPAVPAAAPLVEAAPLAGFWPADQLDRRALPVAAPETSMLDGAQLSGLPLRLRLFIDAQGRVVAVQPQHITPDDEAALPRLQAMFSATAFVPGRLQGRDVPSFTDIELGLETIEPPRLN
jgi:hypothetical protein